MDLNEQDLLWAEQTFKSIDLFRDCSDEELKSLFDGLEKKSFKTGSTILFQGEISNKLFIIKSGKVSVWVRKGKEKIKITDLNEGDFFGEISLLTPRAATATIRAETETDIIVLPGEVVQNIIKNNSILYESINKKIEERLKAQQKAFDNDSDEING